MDYPLLPKQLPARIKRVWRKTIVVTSGLLYLFVGLICAIVYLLDIWTSYWFVAIMSVVVLISISAIVRWALVSYRYTFHRYEMTSEDLAFQKGYFFRSTTIVPINRIQHINTEQGPFLRKEHLIEMRIHTAATTHRIAGLDGDEAKLLRNQIIEMVKAAKEDV